MAEKNEAIYRVGIEGADEASRDLQKVADSQKHLHREIDDTGDEAQQTARQMDGLTREIREADRAADGAGRSLGTSDSQLVSMGKSAAAAAAGFVTLQTAINGALDLLNRYVEQAQRAAELNRTIGQSIGGLAANVGGRLADSLVEPLTEIALEERIGVSGRQELFASVASLTDVETDLTREQIIERARGFARLQRATGLGGADAQSTVQQVTATLGVSFGRAVDITATLVNAGLDASTTQEVLSKAGESGGADLVALLLAARSQVNLARNGRSVLSLISALDRTDEDQTLADELESLGLTPDQSVVERIAAIDSAFQAGQITEAQRNQAIGGAQNLRIFSPIARSLPRLDEARAALDAASVDAELDRKLQSDYVRRAERFSTNELQRQLFTEGFGGGVEAVERADEIATGLAAFGYGDARLGGARLVTDFGLQSQTMRPLVDTLAGALVDALRTAARDGVGLVVNHFNAPTFGNPNTDPDDLERRSSTSGDAPLRD